MNVKKNKIEDCLKKYGNYEGRYPDQSPKSGDEN